MKALRLASLAGAAALAAAVPHFAAEAPDPVLEALVAEALRGSPDVRAAASAAEGARARIEAAGGQAEVLA